MICAYMYIYEPICNMVLWIYFWKLLWIILYVSYIFNFTYIQKFCRWEKQYYDIHMWSCGICVRWLLKRVRPDINMYLKLIQFDEVKLFVLIQYFSISIPVLKCSIVYPFLLIFEAACSRTPTTLWSVDSVNTYNHLFCYNLELMISCSILIRF